MRWCGVIHELNHNILNYFCGNFWFHPVLCILIRIVYTISNRIKQIKIKNRLFMMRVYFYIKYQPIHKPHILHFFGFPPTTKVTRAFSLLLYLSNNILQDTFCNTLNSELPPIAIVRQKLWIVWFKISCFHLKRKKENSTNHCYQDSSVYWKNCSMLLFVFFYC